MFPFHGIFFFSANINRVKDNFLAHKLYKTMRWAGFGLPVCQPTLMITFSALPIKEFYEYAKICSKPNKQTEQYDLQCANLFTCFLCDENELEC